MADPLLVCVAGPTAAGKSDLSLDLAAALNGEVVNCDSLQLYRRLDIGTAKVPPDERRGIPHHCLDLLEPDEHFTAGDYARIARPILRGIARRGRVPIVTGGTGFYLRALLDGLPAVPERNEDLRARLAARETRRPGFLHRALRRLDPASAAAIAPADQPKLIRAVEICLLTGRARSAHTASEPLTGFRIVRLLLDPPRPALRDRIRRRTERMFASGLIEETAAVLASGVPPSAKALQSIGYAQAIQVLQGTMTRAAAVEETEIRTRQYAKRQLTWFRREPGIIPLRSFGTDPALLSTVLSLLAPIQKIAR